MNADGSCPTCGRVIADVVEEERGRAPWHFKLLLVALCVYLGWRLVQAIEWIAGRG